MSNKNIALIQDLLKRWNDLPHRNKEELDALYKRSVMIIRNVFGKDSGYLTDLTAIHFYPNVLPSDETTRDFLWKSGTSELKNLYQTMLDELELFNEFPQDNPIHVNTFTDRSAGPFDLAFSFAGEDREFVKQIKMECDKLGLNSYYDEDRKLEQWGKSFIGEQRKVYGSYETKHFVPFISKHYFTKPIPKDEFSAARSSSLNRDRYILPIKLDNSEIPIEFLLSDTQYIKSSDHTPEQLAQALNEIVDQTNKPAKEVDQLLADELNLPTPRITPRAYSKFEEAEALIAYIGEKFEKYLPKLKNEGYVPIIRKKDDNVRVFVERDGKSLFALNIFFSSMGDNNVGFNFNHQSIMANAQSENGNIEPIFDNEQQKAGYILNDYGNFGAKDFYSKEQAMEFFWARMNEHLESQA